MNPEVEQLPETYLNRKTLIMGEVNSGKTHRTFCIVTCLCHNGHAGEIVVLDLAPQTTAGIGGRLEIAHPLIQVLQTTIIPPRLTGRDSAHILQLARQNAQEIEPLLDLVQTSQRSILVVNDASLYLQAGSLQRFLQTIAVFPTVVMNAYFGQSFSASPFTEVEQKSVLDLARASDRVIRLPLQD